MYNKNTFSMLVLNIPPLQFILKCLIQRNATNFLWRLNRVFNPPVYKYGDTLLSEELLLSSGLNLSNN
jgi:hypothetical protein